MTVLRVSFLLSAVLGTLAVLAIILLWIVLDITGGFDQLSTMSGSVFGPGPGLPSDPRQYLPLAQVASGATLIAVLNVVLVSGCATLGAVLYNTAARFLGGAGLTFTDAPPSQPPPRPASVLKGFLRNRFTGHRRASTDPSGTGPQ